MAGRPAWQRPGGLELLRRLPSGPVELVHAPR